MVAGVTGAEVAQEAQQLGHAAKGYSENLSLRLGPDYYDCSGLVYATYTKLGETGVPLVSETQWNWVQRIPRSQLQPGDLVFAQFPGDNASPGHVGIYVGNNQVYSAEDPAQGIGYSSLSGWGNAVVGYGRAPGQIDNGSAAPASTDSSGGGSTCAGVTLFGHCLGVQIPNLGADIVDWLERGALIVMGAIIVIVGLWQMFKNTSGAQTIKSDVAKGAEVAAIAE